MIAADYINFIARNRRLAAFGFLMAMGSSFGQTYFIGIFGPSVQAEFGLSHTAWGTIYMLGTLASAFVLPWSGKQLDRFPLAPFAIFTCTLLGIASGVMSQVNGTVMLVIAIFLLRQGGQGLMSHVALTTMARHFSIERGRAIAVATLGFAVGEATLPFICVAAIAVIGWRSTYLASAACLLLLWVPAAWWLLRRHGSTPPSDIATAGNTTPDAPVRSWTRKEVISDLRFYLLLPSILAPSMIVTAMFFHHLTLADAKGWSHAWVTGNYVVFAIASIATSLVAGRLIDRYSSARLMPFLLSPLAVAMVLLATADSTWVVVPYFMLLGLNTGLSHTAVPALWAELYGVEHLGAVRSLAASMSVFASALGPVTAGSLMDIGMPIEQVCVVFACVAVLSSILVRLALRSTHSRAP
ncbi:MAG: MFS transporter [Gammaproteobacteria bacterium]|nr:MFS transporter [Gammaproteobacteria bacterium]